MQFGEVEFPRELVNAHEAGELVIFVGAGASMGRPSNLPSFLGLTEIIRDESQLRDVIGDLSDVPLDEVMGDIEKKYDVDVHLRTAVHTGKKSSLPNALHQAIADLARCGDIRVVTTNYDTHLSTALGSSITRYLSPALPMGTDFTGLVYLHGSLTQHPKNLIVTAGDFGRAYLTEAWAARFLERMFATYMTLFIGYSHNDVIMKYLARGLGPQAKRRYVCTHEPGTPMWKQLNIIPVGYSPADSHRALTLAVKAWAIRASSGLLDHQRQVESIMVARQPADMSPEESSYLESIISDENAVQFFCACAEGPGWLTWVSDHPEFRALFDQTRAGSAVSWRLANWFARTYITNEFSDHAMAAFRVFGGRSSPQLWDALARRLLALQEAGDFRIGIRPWLLLLVRNASDQSVIFLDMLLSQCALPADMEAATLLFSYLTEPRVVDVPSVLGGFRPEVCFRGDPHRLHETWNDVFKPSLEIAAAELLPVIDQHLRGAQRDANLSEGSGSRETLGSPVNPIAMSSGAGYEKSLGFLVEAARDCIEALVERDVSRAESHLATWASSDVALLKRLAIHGWTARTDVDASAMVSWLAHQGLILGSDYQSEIAPFIARIVESNDTEAINGVISDILVHADDDGFTPRRALRTLNWMRQRDLATEEIDGAIAALIAQHKDLEKLLQATESVTSQSPPLTTADELKVLLDNDVPAAVTLLQQYATQEQRARAFAWYDIDNMLAGVVRESPALGFKLLDGVDQSSAIGTAVVGPVIRGWSNAIVDDDLAQRILTRIATLDMSGLAGDVAAMLADIHEPGSQGTEWRRFATGRELAKTCWEVIETGPAEQKDDWFHTAMNSPTGQLAIYWIQVIEDEHAKAGGDWHGLPPELSAQLAAMLTCGDGRGDCRSCLRAVCLIPVLDRPVLV